MNCSGAPPTANAHPSSTCTSPLSSSPLLLCLVAHTHISPVHKFCISLGSACPGVEEPRAGSRSPPSRRARHLFQKLSRRSLALEFVWVPNLKCFIYLHAWRSPRGPSELLLFFNLLVTVQWLWSRGKWLFLEGRWQRRRKGGGGRGVLFFFFISVWVWLLVGFNDHPVPVIDFLCLSVEMKCQTVKTINCLATSVSAFTLPLFLALTPSRYLSFSLSISLQVSPITPTRLFFSDAWPCRLIREVSSRLALLLSEPVYLPLSTLTTVMLMPCPHSVKSSPPPHTHRRTPSFSVHLRSTVTGATILQ